MKQAKCKATLSSGRDAKPPQEQFSKVMASMQDSPAFQSLAASSMRLLIRMIAVSGAAGRTGRKDDQGRPIFTFTNSDALRLCGIKSDAFTNAKVELHTIGFMEWVEHGGPVSMTGKVHGTPSTFRLTSGWKTYQPVPKPKRDMSAARKALQAKKMARVNYAIPSSISPSSSL